MRRIQLAVILTLSLILAPLAVEAQQAAKVDLGYVEGQNAVIEAQYADGKFARLPDLAAELVRLKVDVIVAAPTPAVRAAQQATRTIPIVMAFSGDPVSEGFVAVHHEARPPEGIGQPWERARVVVGRAPLQRDSHS